MKSAFLLQLLIGSIFLSSCAGPNLHPGFHAKKPVFQREWSIATRTRETLAGERGVEYSNPVLWENTLLFGTSEAGLVALYPTLGGQIRWVLPIRGGVTSEIARDGSDLYFGAADGFLYSVHAETGRVTWRYDLKNTKVSKPTIHAGKLYVTSSNDVISALEAPTGKLLWQYQRKSGGTASIHGASQPWTDGTQIIAGTSDGYLVVLNGTDGRLLSEKRLSSKAKFTDVDAGVVQDGQVFYVPSYDGDLYALKRGSLETLWRFEAGGTRSVTIDGERLVLASSDGKIYLLQKSSGKVLWMFSMDGGTPTAPIITETVVIVGSSYQYLYAIDKKTGELRDRWNVGYGSGFAGGMAFDPAKSLLYAVSGAANLYTFKVAP